MPRTNLFVSKKGQVTLPALLRKKLGIKDGGMMIIEEREGELILRPAAVLEVELYTDKQIQEWNNDDQLGKTDRLKIKTRFLKIK